MLDTLGFQDCSKYNSFQTILKGLFCLFLKIAPKLHIDIILLIIRGSILFIWSAILFADTDISLLWQLIFVAVIFLSDAFDGIVSRRFSNELEKYRFRILDSLVDKTGMLVFLLALYWLERISAHTFYIIVGYNVALVIPPIIIIVGGFSRSLGWIQATVWSRFYAFCVGLFCFFSIAADTMLQYSWLCSGYFLILGLVSFTSHISKVRGLKGVL